jgi:hypothetical protein
MDGATFAKDRSPRFQYIQRYNTARISWNLREFVPGLEMTNLFRPDLMSQADNYANERENDMTRAIECICTELKRSSPVCTGAF